MTSTEAATEAATETATAAATGTATGAAAAHRRGEPSPLGFHLGAALAAYGQALIAAPRAGSAAFPWDPRLREEARALGGGPGDAFGGDLDRLAVAAEAGRRLTETLRGIEAWQAHPFRRDPAEPPAIWAEGSSRLLDYGQAKEARDPDGPVVLAVPSLINRAYVLDLAPERSLLRWLAGEGFRPFLLDWGEPGPAEAGFDIEDYGARRLLPALAELTAAGRPVTLVGYCMGGTIAAGLAARRPDGIAGLATLGAPWDFGSTSGIGGAVRAAMRARGAEEAARLVEGAAAAFGLVPVALFQLLFAMVDPIQAAVKFRRFARLDPASQAARLFVALEDWLADGVAMAEPAARTLLVDWQLRNATAKGDWRFLGGPVRAEAIAMPALCFAGTRDTIAPPALAEGLAAAIPGARLARPGTGHVGMVVGSRAEREVWQPLAAFLREVAGHGR